MGLFTSRKDKIRLRLDAIQKQLESETPEQRNYMNELLQLKEQAEKEQFTDLQGICWHLIRICYSLGISCEADGDKAYEAAENGFKLGNYGCGRYLAMTAYHYQDYDNALAILEHLNTSESLLLCGEISALAKREELAIEYFKKSFDLGNIDAARALASRISAEDYQSSLPYFRYYFEHREDLDRQTQMQAVSYAAYNKDYENLRYFLSLGLLDTEEEIFENVQALIQSLYGKNMSFMGYFVFKTGTFEFNLRLFPSDYANLMQNMTEPEPSWVRVNFYDTLRVMAMYLTTFFEEESVFVPEHQDTADSYHIYDAYYAGHDLLKAKVNLQEEADAGNPHAIRAMADVCAGLGYTKDYYYYTNLAAFLDPYSSENLSALFAHGFYDIECLDRFYQLTKGKDLYMGHKMQTIIETWIRRVYQYHAYKGSGYALVRLKDYKSNENDILPEPSEVGYAPYVAEEAKRISSYDANIINENDLTRLVCYAKTAAQAGYVGMDELIDKAERTAKEQGINQSRVRSAKAITTFQKADLIRGLQDEMFIDTGADRPLYLFKLIHPDLQDSEDVDIDAVIEQIAQKTAQEAAHHE